MNRIYVVMKSEARRISIRGTPVLAECSGVLWRMSESDANEAMRKLNADAAKAGKAGDPFYYVMPVDEGPEDSQPTKSTLELEEQTT